jgi:hypothetical protein
VKNGIYKDSVIFSTDPSVDLYMKLKYNINCKCLSCYFNEKDILNNRELISNKVDNVLRILDTTISPIINSIYKLNMNFFYPLYSYVGKWHLISYAYFSESLNILKTKYGEADYIFYEHIFNDFLRINTGINDFLETIDLNIDYSIIKIKKKLFDRELGEKIYLSYQKLITILRAPDKVFKYIKKLKNQKIVILETVNGRIFLFDNMYELEFLKSRIKSISKENFVKKAKIKRSILQWNEVYEKIDKEFNKAIENFRCDEKIDILFIRNIKEDFLFNTQSYINQIDILKEAHVKNPIKLAIWGLPPSHAYRALLNEFLLSQNVTVLGAQHGGNYGDSYYPLHFDIDFRRCTHYLSYGFTKSDLERIYKDKQIDIKITPIGKHRLPIWKNRNMKSVDILYPISMNLSMFNAGMGRMPPDKFLGIQRKFIEYLNSQNSGRIYIKSFPFFPFSKDPFTYFRHKYQNIRFNSHLSLLDFLKSYKAKSILLDFPSTPLYEILSLDLEIFLLGDNSFPYDKIALDMLKKRVHYSEDEDEIISLIDSYLFGTLKQKRNNEFYNYYIYKESTESNTINLIQNEMKRSNSLTEKSNFR